MSNAKFIVVEGIDGAGKTEVCKIINNWYERNHFKVENIGASIDATSTGRGVRNLINMGAFSALHVDTQTFLMIAALNEFIETIVKPYLDTATTVICDRFVYSTFVYQFDSKIVGTLCEYIENKLPPDIIFWVDTPPQIAATRVNKRGTPDEMENVDIDKINKRVKRYRALSDKLGIVRINGSLTLDEIDQHVNYFLGHLHGIYID